MIKLVALSLAMAPFLVVVATSTLRASFDEVSSLGRTRPLVLEPLSLLRAQGPLTSPPSADRLEARKDESELTFGPPSQVTSKGELLRAARAQLAVAEEEEEEGTATGSIQTLKRVSVWPRTRSRRELNKMVRTIPNRVSPRTLLFDVWRGTCIADGVTDSRDIDPNFVFLTRPSRLGDEWEQFCQLLSDSIRSVSPHLALDPHYPLFSRASRQISLKCGFELARSDQVLSRTATKSRRVLATGS